MKTREQTSRLRRFDAEEKARKVADLETMIREFEQMASDLDRQVQAEEERTGIKDPAHFAYSTFAKSAAQRRNNLKVSISDLKAKLENAVRERDAAAESLDMAQSAETREQRHGRRTDRPSSFSMR